jgi:hypothetical protein
MDKVLSARNYGICLFSLDMLKEFLIREKIRTKKLLPYFQKNPDKYLAALEVGAWLPFVQIDSVEYLIKLDGYDQPFDDEWEQKMEYGGFNIEIRDSLWFSDTESFYAFNREAYEGNADISYQALHYPTNEIITLYSDIRYDVPSGRYSLSIKGYKRKELLRMPNPNCGFFFSLDKVEKFDGVNNPREQEIYNFNVGCM